MSAQSTPQYRDVPDFPGYRVGDDGSVWGRLSLNGIGPMKDDWRRLSPGNCRGYHLYGLQRGGRRYNRTAHRLVLEAFVGPRPPGTECCHGDGNRGNNALANLRWDTRKSNHADALRHGTHPRGEGHGNATMTEADVEAVAVLLAEGFSRTEVALQTGVDLGTVSRIALGKAWSHTRTGVKAYKALKRTEVRSVLQAMKLLASNMDNMPAGAAADIAEALRLLGRAREVCRGWWGRV
jgi:hypothetical protein